MTSTILVCTVGGSPQPVIGAIQALRPSHIVFLCTQDVPAKKQKGSSDQVPGILAAVEHPDSRANIVIVPPDDPDAVFAAAKAELDRLTKGQHGRAVVADYTGGTKA